MRRTAAPCSSTKSGTCRLSLQSKILRFLEQGEVQRLGGNDNLKVDVRVVAATNADLKKMIAEQKFREDLYYRLAVFPIHLPPLRDRMSDLEELAVAFTPNSTRSFAEPRSAADSEAAHLAWKRPRVAQRNRAGDDPGGNWAGNQARTHFL
jgi:transcriptional regulator with GAF, ATPase, and Fis domain